MNDVSTRFRFYGVVAALSVGLLAGRSRYDRVDDLAALRSVDEDSEHRLVEPLLSVSRLVHAKYAMTRKALVALGAGTALCIAVVIAGAVITYV